MKSMNKKNDLSEILNPIARYLNDIDAEIRIILQTGVPVIDGSSLHLFVKGGKKIRAALVLLTGGMRGQVPGGIIPIAAAAEIVHAATLIHDDIIDQSLFRRGYITVPRKWGNKVSVLVGDFMYTEALNVSVADGDPRLFPVVVMGARDMVKGELYQLQYSNLDSITMDHYYRIIELKTARFMAACTKLGAIKAGFSDRECDIFYEYGLNLGYAFQIVDDTLDYIDNPLGTGKDEGNDYTDGKITLPALFVLDKDKEAASELRTLLQDPEQGKWSRVRDIINGEDSVDYCLDVARQYIDKANDIIFSFPESGFRDILYELSQFFVYRRY